MVGKMKKLILGSLMGILGTGCSFFGVQNVEQPNYKVIVKQNDKEIRKYNSHIVAKTVIQGSFKDAQKEGFRILAGYIFGKNKSQQKIEMTAPVVIASDENTKSWTMTFSMPSRFTLETLPTPDDDRIKIEEVETRFVAALTFTGFWGEDKNAEKGNELNEWLEANKGYEIISKPMFAGYNPPWTLPFLRRNEMLIEIKPSADTHLDP